MAQIADQELTAEPAEGEGRAQARVLRTVIWTFAGASVVAAGMLLWASQGESVFASLVSAAIAWCF